MPVNCSVIGLFFDAIKWGGGNVVTIDHADFSFLLGLSGCDSLKIDFAFDNVSLGNPGFHPEELLQTRNTAALLLQTFLTCETGSHNPFLPCTKWRGYSITNQGQALFLCLCLCLCLLVRWWEDQIVFCTVIWQAFPPCECKWRENLSWRLKHSGSCLYVFLEKQTWWTNLYYCDNKKMYLQKILYITGIGKIWYQLTTSKQKETQRTCTLSIYL